MNRFEERVMILLWCMVSAALVVALMAWRQARRTATQLVQLSEMQWELRYQLGELRAQLQRPGGDVASAPVEAPAVTSIGESFVSLSSLKR